MAIIKIPDLNNAKLDVDHMAKLATSAALTATDRLGNTKKTWSGIEQDLGAEYAETVTGANRLATDQARDQAESAKDSALAAGKLYTSVASAQADAGLAVGAGYVAPSTSGDLQAYRKDGPSGSTPIGTPFATSVAVQSANARITAAVGTTNRVGLMGTPSAGAGAVDVGTYVFSPVAAFDGALQQVKFQALAGGTLTLKRFTKSGDTFTFVGQAIVPIASSGLKTLTKADFGDFSVLVGELVGFYATSGLVAYVAGAVDASSAWYSTTSNVTTSFVDASASSTTQMQIGLDVVVTGSTNAAVAIAAKVADESAAALTRDVALGAVNSTTPGAALSSNTWVLNTPASGTGDNATLEVFGTTAGSITLGAYTKSGNNFDRIRSVDVVIATGWQNIAAVIAVKKGEILGVSLPAGGGRIGFIARAVGPDLAWRSGPADALSFTSAVVQMGSQLQMAFHMNVISKPESTGGHALTLKNSSRIGGIGDSLMTGYYQQAGKNWLSKVSLFSDWNFENMSVSGDTATGQLAKIRDGTIVYNDLSWVNYGVDVALITLGANDALSGTLAQFSEKMRQLIQTARGLGAVPAVSTEYLASFNPYAQVAFKNIAQQEGALLCDVLQEARTMDFGTKYAGFYATSGVAHPGVRTNDLIAKPVEDFIKRFGRPRRSMKIFRKRVGVAVSTVADLMFDGVEGRAKIFNEIRTGHRALATASEKFYDELMPVAGYSSGALVASEYLKLMAGGTVTFADYGLIDAIFDAVAKNIDRVEVTLSDMAVELYIRDVLGTPIQADGLPVGTWKQITAAGGKFTISRADLVRAMSVDKLSMLLHKTGGFAIAEPVIVMYGELGKPLDPFVEPQGRARGAELLAKTDCNTTTDWTLVGAPTAAVPADGMLPRGATACITVNATDKLRQNFTYAQDDRWDNEVEIRVRCRRWVPIFPSSGDYATAPITADSYDWARLSVELIAGGNSMPIKARVGLSWNDIVLRTVLPLGTTTMDIQVSADLEVQVAMASVKPVSA